MRNRNKHYRISITAVILPAALLLLASVLAYEAKNKISGTDMSVSPGSEYELRYQEHFPETGAPDVSAAGTAYNTINKVDPVRLQKLEDRAVSAMLLIKDIYASADKGSTYNVVLSEETLKYIADVLGAEGLTVVDFDEKSAIRNPEALDCFGKRINSCLDADVTYFVLCSDGSMNMNELSYKDGSFKQITVSLEWTRGDEPRIYSEGQYILNSIKYTEKGWLILDRDISDFQISKKFNVDSHTMIRVKPYDETCRQLCEKYISPVGYSENNLFTSSWHETDFGEVDFNCLYPILYGAYFKKDPLIMNTAVMLYGMVDNTYLSLVPATEFEEVIKAFFNISTDKIRCLSDFSSTDNGYYICGFQTGYYNVVPRLPEPEVTDYWYNDDGTMTLRVDAVYSWYGTDQAFTHETTVRDTDTGLQYVSNFVYESGNNIFPEATLQAERRTQMQRCIG